MIAELFFIMDALQAYESQPTTPTVVTVTPRKTAKTPTPGSSASLAGQLRYGGQITKITMPLSIRDYDSLDAARDYMAGVEQYSTQPESIKKRLETGRL
jgi:hypothetical protein